MQDIERHRKAATAAVDAAFEAGRLQGVAEERARVKALLDQDLAPPSNPRPAKPNPSRTGSSYGSVMNAVRPALRDIGEAIDANSMAELVGNGITVEQCRNALRQLQRNGEAEIVERGKYLWRGKGESPQAEKPGTEVPGHLNLIAAE